MKRIGMLIVCLAGLVFVLPFSPAQDEKKKDPDKTEKKDDAKDPEKKDEEKKKTDSPSPKPKKVIEKMPPYSGVMRTKVLSASGENNREFTVEKPELDPQKVQETNNWAAQRQLQLAQQYAQASTQKDFKARATALANWQRDSANYQVELAKRSAGNYTMKPMEVRAREDAKVRTFYLPVMFDDEGKQKKWTEKEKKELRGDTQIPGYPSDFDQIKSGQYVDLYMYKKPPPPKGEKTEPKKKKGPDDDPEVKTVPEFILIVIISSDGK
jgi:membrane-bound lytic murein transglycosylase